MSKKQVVCIGDSITRGTGSCSYPALLAGRLSEAQGLPGEYEVINAGLGGRAVSKTATYPYSAEPRYQEVQQMQPQIVVFCLGTNDATEWDSSQFQTGWYMLLLSIAYDELLQEIDGRGTDVAAVRTMRICADPTTALYRGCASPTSSQPNAASSNPPDGKRDWPASRESDQLVRRGWRRRVIET